MKASIRIVIAEDEPAILRGILAAVKGISDEYVIAGTAYNGKDALELIRRESPHVVISDIRMPLMDGLEMIRQAKQENDGIRFIILTGFAEFEYARTALTLGVTEYLVKPIDPEKLEQILSTLRKGILAETRQAQYTYIKNNFYGNLPLTFQGNPLLHYQVYYLFCYYGPIVSNMYGEFSKARELAGAENISFLQDLEERFSLFLYSFRGNYFNEHIYALVYPEGNSLNLPKLLQEIRNHTQTDKPYTNYILSEKLDGNQGFDQMLRNTYLYTLFHVPFGRCCVMDCSASQESGQVPDTPPETASLFLKFHSSLSPGELNILTGELVKLWEEQEISQFQLQADIRTLLGHCLQQNASFQGNLFDPAEIVAYSYSFQELQENLLAQLKKIFHIEDRRESNAKSLCRDVKKYLDANFIRQISRKDFNDLFGYSEKYITSLFKDEYNKSPSRYMVDLRLNLAKELMQKNPDILLKDVAERVGYADPLYFSRVFKNSEGVSPSAFQKSLAHKNTPEH